MFFISRTPVYHGFATEDSGVGPFAFAIRCSGCHESAQRRRHSPECPIDRGHGISLDGGGVVMFIDGDVRRYERWSMAFADYENRYPERDDEFVWGPNNPNADLSFF